MQPQSNHLLIVVGATIISWILRVSWAGLACLSNPCLNGICIDDINSSVTCFCADGFTGELCGTNWDECWSSPCANGGTCTDSIAAFNCTCPQGFTGDRCEWNVDECASNPCLNGGSCVDQENGFVCFCPPGYAGHFCGIDVSVCNISYPMPHIPGPRCYNGGICLDGPGPSFTCLCITGWTGSRCEVQINECESSPCRNGGLCIDLIADYACACPFGYTGKNCEMTLQMCRGINGTRISIFGGMGIDSLEEENEEDICENGALCLLESDGEKVCYCVPDYHGDRCQYRYDECLLAESGAWLPPNGSSVVSGGHCKNGGECIDGVDSFSCSCPENFTGQFCECPLYIMPDSDVDPYCLSTSTYSTMFSTFPSEVTPSIKTSTTPHSVVTGTPFFITSITQVSQETTTQEAGVTTSVTTDAKSEIYTVTELDQKFTATSQPTIRTTSDIVSQMTTMSTSTLSLSEPTTVVTDSTSVSVHPPTVLTGVSTESVALTQTSPIGTELLTYFPDYSSTEVPKTPGVIGEDKVWVTEETTTSLYDDSIVSQSDSTSFAFELTSEPISAVTDVPPAERKPERITTTIFSLMTEKTTESTSVGTDTQQPQYTSTESISLPSDESTTQTIATIEAESTTDHELFSTTESSEKPEDVVTSTIPVTVTTLTGISEITDSLVTYLYSTEKATSVPDEFSTGDISTAESGTTEELDATTSSTTDESPTTWRITAEEMASTTVEAVVSTDDFTTETTLYPEMSSFQPTTEVTPDYDEHEIDKMTSTTTDSASTPPTDEYPLPGLPTHPHTTTQYPKTTTVRTTTLGTSPFTLTTLDVTKPVTEPQVPAEEYTTKIYTTTTPQSEKEFTSKYTSTRTPVESSTSTVPETYTYLSTLEVSETDRGIDITSTTEVTQATQPTEIGCNVTPCLNGGTCYYDECECTFRFSGKFCENKKTIEVASFNGNSYLIHSLNSLDHLNQEDRNETLELDDPKANFKRHVNKNGTANGTAGRDENDEGYHDMFEEVYEYYDEDDYMHEYRYDDHDESYEIYKDSEYRHNSSQSSVHSKSMNSSENSSYSDNDQKLSINSSFEAKSYSFASSVENGGRENSSSEHEKPEMDDTPSYPDEYLKNSEIVNMTQANSSHSKTTLPSNGTSRNRGGRSLKGKASISTSIFAKINLQERSHRVGGWGLVMKITLGHMAKASLAINHITGLMRFHFTCGRGRSLLFGEEDGQRWIGQGRRQPIHSMVIPVHVVLDVLPYQSAHKSSAPSGRSYLQCMASLKINGQVAVRGQQRTPMPKKPSSTGGVNQSLLFLGGIPDMLLPCNHAIDNPVEDEEENSSKYEQTPEHEEDDEHEGFVGCMKDLMINGIKKEIFEDAIDGSGITECGEVTVNGKELDDEDNPCFSLPCYGGSTCEVTENEGWRCRCPTGWLGQSCELSVCDNNPCLYGATCLQDDVGGFLCLCPLGKGGRLCEHDIDVSKPCFDSGNNWEIEEHQPYIAYPLDHNQLSSPQLVFKFKFAPSSINQIGLLAYIGDLKLPQSLQMQHPSLLSEIRNSYLETTTYPTTSDSSQKTENPSVNGKMITKLTLTTPRTSQHEDPTNPPPKSINKSGLLQEIASDDESNDSFNDFLPPPDIPIFQDDTPSYLQNFSTMEAFNSLSSYIFSPFAPYPYHVRQNGKDHIAVSYIRGHLVLTWDLGSGPRRIFTTDPLPMLNEEMSSEGSTERMPFLSLNPSNHPILKKKQHRERNSNGHPFLSPLIPLPPSLEEPPLESVSETHNNSEIQPKSNLTSILHARDPKRAKLLEEFELVQQNPILNSSGPVPFLHPNVGNTNKSLSDTTANVPQGENQSARLSSTNPAVVHNYPADNGKDYSTQNLKAVGLDSIISSSSLPKKQEDHEVTTNSPHDETLSPPFGGGVVVPRSVTPPSSNHFHEVTIWREGQQAWLKVGDHIVRGHSPGQHNQLNAHRPFLYLGGHDANDVSSLPHDIPLHSSFSGCIFDAELRFGARRLNFNRQFTKGRGVGECGVNPCKSFEKQNGASPCLNGGTCVPRGPTFICLCQKSWFGPLCADYGQNSCDEGVHSCRSGSTCVTLPMGGYRCDCLPGTHGIYCEKDSPIGWSVRLTGHRSFLGVRVPYRGWRRRPSATTPLEKPKREAFCIDLEIKPSKPNSGGVILFVMGSHLQEYLSLSINNKGEPELRIGPGSSRLSGPLVIGYNGKFKRENVQREVERLHGRAGRTDGRSPSYGWKKIRIFRRGQRVFLAMDGLLHGAGSLDTPSQNLPTIRPYNNSIGSSLPLLYLGGLPDISNLPQDAIGDVRYVRPFVGCIRSLAVDWQRVPLGEGAGSLGRNAYAC